jgi:hypothetical protein
MNNKSKSLKITVIMGLAAAVPVFGDEAALQKQIDELQKIVKQLQQQVTAGQAAPAQPAAPQVPVVATSTNTDANAQRSSIQPYVTPEDFEAGTAPIYDQISHSIAAKTGVGVTVSGTATVRYTDQVVLPSTFSIPSAQISFAGSLRSDPVNEGDVKYVATFAYAGPSASYATSTAAASSTASSTNITDAYITWSPKTVGKGGTLQPAYSLLLTLGQQPVYFGNDNYTNEELKPTVNSAAYLGAFKTRDVGLSANGGLNWHYDSAATTDQQYVPTISYLLGVFNGSGANALDDNRDKSYLGKLVWTPFTKYSSFFQGLQFGASDLYWKTGTSGTGGVIHNLTGLQAQWTKLPFMVTGEYVFGKDDVAKGADTHKKSYLTTLFYRPGKLPDLEPLVRFERYLSNSTLRKNGRKDIVTVGFNYYFWQLDPVYRPTYSKTPTSRVLKVQVNYNFVDDTTKAPGLPNANQFLTQAVLSF